MQARAKVPVTFDADCVMRWQSWLSLNQYIPFAVEIWGKESAPTHILRKVLKSQQQNSFRDVKACLCNYIRSILIAIQQISFKQKYENLNISVFRFWK